MHCIFLRAILIPHHVEVSVCPDLYYGTRSFGSVIEPSNAEVPVGPISGCVYNRLYQKGLNRNKHKRYSGPSSTGIILGGIKYNL